MKQKEIFDRLVDESHDEIQNVTQKIDYNKLTYYFKTRNKPKNFIGSKAQLGFSKNIRDGHATLEDA